MQYILFEIACKRQVNRIRILLFDLLIHRGIGYFDSIRTGALNSSIFENIEKIRSAIGWELSFILTDFGVMFGVNIATLIINWRLAFLVIFTTPIILIISLIFAKKTARATLNELNSYGKANSIAEEVFGLLRTVLALNGTQFERRRYDNHLDKTIKMGKMKAFAYGVYEGITFFLLYCTYPIVFYYGSVLMTINNSGVTITTILIVIFSVIQNLTYISLIGTFIQVLAEATGAAGSVWQLIDESIENEEIKKQNMKMILNKEIPMINQGEIVFDNVSFAYPTRPTVDVLRGLSFVAKQGKTTALVGSSGSGKSSCVQLLLRFYDFSNGKIQIDGHDITDFNAKQLRQRIGVVSQEPILFATSIYENIHYGNENANQNDIEEAARQANAHQFIENLPNKYQTLVGERGVQLSGGEKQRIALARALVRKPVILILDEATSALDYRNEAIVQDALDRACQDYTTIIISHRLSTIKKADSIYVLNHGISIENGNHSSLIELNGVYAKLFQSQQNNSLFSNQYEQTENNEDEIQMDYCHIDRCQDRILSEEMNEMSMDAETIKKNNRRSWKSFIDIMCLNKSEWIWIIAGCASGLGCGLAAPISVILYGYTIKVFTHCYLISENKRLIFLYISFIILGIIVFFLRIGQGYFFGCSGSALVRRLRSKAFATMLRQEIGWHDRPENHSGALCVRLSNGAQAIQKMTGVRLSLVFEAVGTWVIGCFIGFIFCWQLTLIMLCYIISLCFLSIVDFKWKHYLNLRTRGLLQEASSITIEAFHNMRTVKQLTQENQFVNRYKEALHETFTIARTHLLISGIIYGIIVVSVPFVLVILYIVTVNLAEHGILKSSELIYAFVFATFCLQTLEIVFLLREEWGETISAVDDFLELFERKPLIDNGDMTNGIILNNFTGHIQMKDIHFRYPARSNRIILDKCQLIIESGQQVALVGPSGCGKSTIIQLLQRFYDANEGQILLDGHDIRSLNLHWVRSQLGLVGQEPILFNMTIRENITYGLITFTEQQITEAAQKANIHQLIQSLPDGYNTNVGLHGTQLSGGEKQRIAIARILIRQPKILLFDEATSALDSYNEQIVQNALNQATFTDDMNRRTTITVAHRLSTIQSSDLIVVFNEQGRIAEPPGPHEQLMARFGPYFHMQNINS